MAAREKGLVWELESGSELIGIAGLWWLPPVLWLLPPAL